MAEGAHDAVNHILVEKNADAEKMIPAQTTYETAESLTYKFTQDSIDTTSYATSAETGAAITNLFDEADINLFDGGAQAVNYVTRSDWRGSFDDSSLETMLQSKISLNVTDAIYQGLINEQFTKPEGADQVEMPTMKAENGLVLADFVGVGRDETIIKNGKEWTFDDLLDQMSFVEMRSLILLGQHNTKNVASIAKPATSDQNGPCGFASTFVSGGSGTAFPSSTLRATTWNKGLTRRVGEIIGEDGLHSGSNGLYGPGANIHRNAFCGRNYEYYSEDPILSALIGTEECQGIQSKGIIVYEKHFALNDSESHREGVGTWENEQAIREIYLTAFHQILSKDGGNAHAIMTGFNRLGTTWTGDSINLIEKVARGEWGFDGFSCTDMSPDSTRTPIGNLQWPLPVAGTITSQFGHRVDPITGEVSSHTGTDIACAEGTPILAAANGTVTVTNGLDSWGGSYGYYIQIDHSGGLETLYAHCSAICVTTGQQVQAGQVIGYVGQTGRVTGSHLHLETRVNGSRVDSMQFFS